MILRNFLSIFLILSLSSTALAEPDSIKFTAPVVCTAGDKSIDLSPGRYLVESDWLKVDSEIVDLQNDVTRLTAENNSLKESGGEIDWRLVAAATVLGMALGGYIYHKAAN